MDQNHLILSFIAANRTKIYHGLLKEPDLNIPMEEEEEPPEGDGDKPKVRKKCRNALPYLFGYERGFLSLKNDLK